MGGHRLPVTLFLLWVAVELAPALAPPSMSDEGYRTLYLFSEDIASIVLASACYFSLTYTSTVLKGLSLATVVIAASLFGANLLVAFTPITASFETGIILGTVILAVYLILIRFIFRLNRSSPDKIKAGNIYLVYDKPHSFIGMLGLFLSGRSGMVSAWASGYCYRFSTSADGLLKEIKEDYLIGKTLVDYGPATENRVASLDALVGQKWSLFNNCFTVFSRWRREWG